jgi:hypothetical protein
MKKIILINLFSCIIVSFLYSQKEDQFCDCYKKEISNVGSCSSFRNHVRNDEIEKLLLGNFIATIEFFYNSSDDGASCFRMMVDPYSKSCIVEIKYISNFQDANNEARRMYPSIGLSGNDPSITDDRIKDIKKHNTDAFAKQDKERINLYKIKKLSHPISKQFALELYEKMYLFIDNFKGKRNPLVLRTDYFRSSNFSSGGYLVTFRTLVEDELCSLWIHEPRGNALKMADLCRQIISDAIASEFDESKYMSVLNSFKN